REEGRNWGEPVACIPEGGSYVLNNDRVLQLKSGRIILPLARHAKPGQAWSARGTFLCSYSDNAGRTWKRSSTELDAPPLSNSGLQEPGLVELKDGRLMMIARTDLGCQYQSFSKDGGDTWTAPE